MWRLSAVLFRSSLSYDLSIYDQNQLPDLKSNDPDMCP